MSPVATMAAIQTKIFAARFDEGVHVTSAHSQTAPASGRYTL